MIDWEEPTDPPVPRERITLAEHRWGIEFPEMLVDLWLRADRLRPVRPEFYQSPLPDAEAIDVMCWLLPFDELTLCHEALSEYAREGQDLSRVIPVGDTGDGFICLDYRSGNAPAVVDYSMSYATTIDEDADPLIYVASSFAEFLTLFR